VPLQIRVSLAKVRGMRIARLFPQFLTLVFITFVSTKKTLDVKAQPVTQIMPCAYQFLDHSQGRDAALRRPGRRSAPTLPKTKMRTLIPASHCQQALGGREFLYWIQTHHWYDVNFL
jgi:hypothetical protein